MSVGDAHDKTEVKCNHDRQTWVSLPGSGNTSLSLKGGRGEDHNHEVSAWTVAICFKAS